MLAGISILIAEDCPEIQFLLATMLREIGASVDVADNGKEAIEKALNAPFDVILMDIQMPLMDGFEATRALRAAGYRKPIIALTAYAMAEERSRTASAGCDVHLTKPIDPDQLFSTVLKLALQGS